MLALYAEFDPKGLQGDTMIFDPYTREPVSRGQMAKAYREWRWMIGMMKDIDSGFIHMMMNDYLKLPAMFTKIRSAYSGVRDAYRRKD